jgi:outer membrane protein
MQNRILIEQQQIDLQISRIRLEQQEQQYRAEAAKAVNVLRNAERAVDASERALKAAEESLRSAEERLKVGAGIQTDVIVAQATIQAARTNNVNAVYSLLYAQKQLEYLLGKWNY